MSTHRALAAALVAALCGLVPMAAEAQGERWSVEGRIGSTIPTGDLTDGAFNQTAGLSVGGGIMYTFNTNITAYGGVGHNRFNCDDCSTDVSSTGLDGGLKLLFGSNEDAMPWLRAGLMFHKPEVEDSDGDWNTGLDSGLGIDWRATDQLVLVPAVRYNTYGTDAGPTFSYFTVDVGAHLHFGG